MIRETLEYVSQGLDMTENHAFRVMNQIMEGEWTAAQVAGFLMAAKIKGETVSELAGFVRAMRQRALKIAAPADAVDTCGTGGDGKHSFNVSTAAAIAAAATGVTVAKHGNRSVSSKTGSADVLQQLGVKIDLTPQQAEACLRQVGLAFLFAPVYHASMKHAATPRRELGVRTLFNLLGPLSNPANTRRQVLGVFSRDAAEKMVKVLQHLGSEHVLVVHSRDGMDELSVSSETIVYELKDGEIRRSEVKPEQFGIRRADLADVRGDDAAQNARQMSSVFDGQTGPLADITALNAGAAIYVAGKTSTLAEGVDCARAALADGAAKEKLAQLVRFTQTCGEHGAI